MEKPNGKDLNKLIKDTGVSTICLKKFRALYSSRARNFFKQIVETVVAYHRNGVLLTWISIEDVAHRLRVRRGEEGSMKVTPRNFHTFKEASSMLRPSM